jgi:hypothetical protein
MLDIIAGAHSKRYKIPEDGEKKEAIVLTDTWFEELTKHPYFSSKTLCLTLFRKTRYWHLPHEGTCKASEGAQTSRES